MLNTEEDVERLDQRALCIAPAAVLVPFADSVTTIIEYTVWQSRGGHILASREERADLVEEDGRGTFLVHSAEHGGNVINAACDLGHEASDTPGIVGGDGIKHVQHMGEQLGTDFFDCN